MPLEAPKITAQRACVPLKECTSGLIDALSSSMPSYPGTVFDKRVRPPGSSRVEVVPP
jgi:hypothetical protein